MQCISADNSKIQRFHVRCSQIFAATIGGDLARAADMRIRLTQKLAGRLDGIDVSHLKVGDIIELPTAAAAILIAERWAEVVAEPPIEPEPLR